MFSFLFQSSHASKRPSKSHLMASNHSMHSRSFDPGSPPSRRSFSTQDRRQHKADRYFDEGQHRDQRHSGRSHRDTGRSSHPETYGTYVLSLETRGNYKNMDPTACRCNCCPHPCGVSGGSNVHRHDPDAHHRHGARVSAPHSRVCDSTRQVESFRRSSHHRSRGREASREHRFIDVVDNSSGSSRSRQGMSGPVAVSTTTSVDSILSCLAPDRKRTNVVVHWHDGTWGDLSSKVSVNNLLLYAERFEIRAKKRVHWGHDGWGR